jgi:ABC-2 type transport system permease protein
VRNILAIAGKDLRSYFTSPIAYVVLTGYLLLAGWFFFNLLANFNQLLMAYMSFSAPDMLDAMNLNEMVVAPLLLNLAVVLVILVPMITMRSFAEEKRNGTYELLMTSPITVFEIVAGKFLGGFVFILMLVSLTGLYPLILIWFGDPEVGIILSGLLGLLLLGSSFVAIGLFTSSLTDNQIIAAVSCLVTLLLLYIIAWPAQSAGDVLGPLLRYLSLTEHFNELVKGVIDTRDLVYFLSVIAVALFLTLRSVESLRWR